MGRDDHYRFQPSEPSDVSFERAVERHGDKILSAAPSLPSKQPIKPDVIVGPPQPRLGTAYSVRSRVSASNQWLIWNAIPSLVAGIAVGAVLTGPLGLKNAILCGVVAFAVIFILRWYTTALNVLLQLLAVVVGTICFPAMYVSFKLGPADQSGEAPAEGEPFWNNGLDGSVVAGSSTAGGLGSDPNTTWALFLLAVALIVAIVLLGNRRETVEKGTAPNPSNRHL